MMDVSPAKDLAEATPDEPAVGTRIAIVSSLLSIAKSTRAFLTLRLTEIGLHPGQDQLLSSLEMGVPVSVSMLADQLGVRPSTVSKMLDRLIEKDFVRRASFDGDARRTMVLLTERGLEKRAEVNAVWQRLEAELLMVLPGEDHLAVARALTQVDATLAVRLRRHR